jgi:hypothetical protein
MPEPVPILSAYIAQLKQAARDPLPPSEEWKDHVERISVPGRIAEVTEEQYYEWLEALPPQWMSGSHFCFAEGAEAFRFFWQERDGRYFARQLTWDETQAFCRLARIPLPY